MDEYCKHCGWPKLMHEDKAMFNDSRQRNYDYSFDDCPGFKLDDDA